MTAEVAPVALADDRKARRNVFVLAAAGALGGAVPSISFAISAIAAYDFLEDKSLATLPITAFVVGTACGTVPAALLMRKVGRRAGFITGMLVSFLGVVLSGWAMFLVRVRPPLHRLVSDWLLASVYPAVSLCGR